MLFHYNKRVTEITAQEAGRKQILAHTMWRKLNETAVYIQNAVSSGFENTFFVVVFKLWSDLLN